MSVTTQGKPSQQTLKQRYYTPSEANIARDSHTYSVHKPILLSNALLQSQQYAKFKALAESMQAPQKMKTLDGFALLDATGAGVPDDAREAVLSNKSLFSVVDQDMNYFTNLQFLDVSENHLNVHQFANLAALKELRLPCNAITQIVPLSSGFRKLLSLDLSFNKVSIESIRSLYYLPILRDLDLSGNELKSLPRDMFHLKCLEKVILERNKLDGPETFQILCSLPQIRVVSVAYNFLSEVPAICCSDSKFKHLEYADLAFNYFGCDENIRAITRLSRLHTLILYGNPILGPTGEDSLRVYVEDLDKEVEEYRQGYNMKFLEIVTEIPRRKLKKGQHLGRQANYHNFKISRVDKQDAEESRTTIEWRQEGQKTLFAEAMAAAKLQMMTRSEGIPDFTFITGTGLAEDAGVDDLAESVMQKVASEMGIGNSAELLILRDKALLPPSLMSKLEAASRQRIDEAKIEREALEGSDHLAWMRQSGPSKVVDDALAAKAMAALASLRDENAYDDSDEALQGGGNSAALLADVSEKDQVFGAKLPPIADSVPTKLFQRNMAVGQTTLHSHPIELQTAIRALKFALKNPLTNYSEIPDKGFLPPKGYAKLTENANVRKLPQRIVNPKLHSLGSFENDMDEAAKRKQGRGLSESLVAKQTRKENQMATLRQIEDVLDNLNDSTEKIVVKGISQTQNSKETIARMKSFARPNNTIDSLVGMINEVITDLS